MSAIDGFTAVAVAAVALYVGRESPALGVAIVAVTGALGVARAMSAGRGRARIVLLPRNLAKRRGPQKLDRWLPQLGPPIGRYPCPRQREYRVVVKVLLFIVGVIALIFGLGLPVAGAVMYTPLACAAMVVVWYECLGAPIEIWVYDAHLAIVHQSHYELRPFDEISRVRFGPHEDASSQRIEWEDHAGRRTAIADRACAEHVYQALERGVLAALARHAAARLRCAQTVRFDPPFALGLALMLACAVAVGLWVPSDAVQRELDRVSLVDRWLSPRGQDEPASDKFVWTLLLCQVLVFTVMVSRWNARRVRLTGAGISALDGSRFIAWSDVRCSDPEPLRLRVHGDGTTLQIDLRAWNAVLVPKIAELMAAAEPLSPPPGVETGP